MSGKVKIWPRMGLAYKPDAKLLASELSTGPLKWSPLTDLHPFPRSLTHLRNSSGLPSQKFCIGFISQAHSGPYFVFLSLGPLEVSGGRLDSDQSKMMFR